MRIALYCPNKSLSHPHPSGDLVIAQGIQSSLRRLGHDCVEIVQFRSRWFWKTKTGWVDLARAWIDAFRKTRAFNPHVWLTYHTYYKSPDAIGPWIGRLLAIPYAVFQPMYADRRRKSTSTALGFRLNRWAILSAARVFTNNLLDLEALRRVLPARRITHLAPGIFPEEFQKAPCAGAALRRQFHIPPDRLLILTAARWRQGVKTESFLHLLRALVKLRDLLPAFTLLVVGDGPQEPYLRSLALRELSGRVAFAGRIPREEMFRFYSAADVFAFPGIGESLGMVYLEAQSCGVPVVALDTAGVPQVVVHGKTGLLVPKDDGRAMAQAVAELGRDAELRRKLGSAGARFVREERNLHKNYGRLAEELIELARSGGRE